MKEYVEHNTDEATGREEWRLAGKTSAFVRLLWAAGVIFLAVFIAGAIAEIGGAL